MAAALAALLIIASGCASLASSSGTAVDRIVSGAHSEVRAVGLVAEAALEDPPAPAVTLTVVLDQAEEALVNLRDDARDLEGEYDDLLALLGDAIEATGQARTAVESGDRDALDRAVERADELAAALGLWSPLL